MDKMLYIASSGASQDLLGTALRSNNLANAQTNGFKAQLEQARAMPAFGEGLPTRVFAMTESPTNDYEGGAMIQTGRNLDVALQGDGWLAVNDKQGNEAYTRAGSLHVDQNGMLTDSSGNPVIGDRGPMQLPIPLSNISIANDGTISVQPLGAPANVQEEVGRLKLVNPGNKNIERGLDGLFRQKDGAIAVADANVQVRTGMLENSNVNPIEEMVNLISLQRHYEMQVKLMKKASELDAQGNNMMRIL
ncbi:flagellar basal-body rod protein FlgF [Neptunicella sp.]|uniref:flagellar basal-body rod protein FlgF n=1 Tax=Neptunicella sp. TaxID=2125986 RepID=UPI003F693A2D